MGEGGGGCGEGNQVGEVGSVSILGSYWSRAGERAQSAGLWETSQQPARQGGEPCPPPHTQKAQHNVDNVLSCIS